MSVCGHIHGLYYLRLLKWYWSFGIGEPLRFQKTLVYREWFAVSINEGGRYNFHFSIGPRWLFVYLYGFHRRWYVQKGAKRSFCMKYEDARREIVAAV